MTGQLVDRKSLVNTVGMEQAPSLQWRSDKQQFAGLMCQANQHMGHYTGNPAQLQHLIPHCSKSTTSDEMGNGQEKAGLQSWKPVFEDVTA